jgi:biotin-dependent carboxylase-like uncharacterized protein
MIEVLQISPLATVQDRGRDGHWHQGLGRAGAMDALSLAMANLLLGNDPGAAGLEIPLSPARFRFVTRGAFALAGAACGARLGGRPLPAIWAGVAEAGDNLELGSMIKGAQVYLALPGGIDVPEVMGSRSTQLREGFGGYQGRVLASGDVLRPTHVDLPWLPAGGLSLDAPPLRMAGKTAITLRALACAEEVDFTPEAQAAFWGQDWAVSREVSRMGYRLDGPTLERQAAGELRSHGIVPGIVQVPGGGQPIIQLADSATMGGYPKIAAVIEPDLWRVAQARPGDLLRFHRVGPAEAAAAEADQQGWLAGLQHGLGEAAALQERWG